MRCVIHRGTHEIGGSCIEVNAGKTRLLLDMGYPLFINGLPADEAQVGEGREALLASGVLPAVSGLYAWDEPAFDAVIISHAHIDHYGLLPWLHPDIPVYLSRGSAALIDLSQRFGICAPYPVNQRFFEMYRPFVVGEISIKPFLMDHSAFDAAAFEIMADGKTLQYTGDFRGHGRKSSCLGAFLRQARKQADALLIEGTMLGRLQEETKSEAELEDDLTAILQDGGPVLFQCSSQNIDRLVSFYRASLRSGRLFVIDVYTANVLRELRGPENSLPAPGADHPQMKVFYPQRLTRRIFDEIGPEYALRFSSSHISKAQIQQARDRVCLMVRPSMRSDLNRMPALQDGRFVYSLWQGYREKPAQRQFEQFLADRGFAASHVHTSGHARVPDLQLAMKKLDPQKIVPVHGFFPEQIAGWSANVMIQQDGAEFEI